MKISDIFTSKEPGALDTVEWILRVTVVTLAMIMLAVILTLMGGLFVDNVDNKEVFAIIGLRSTPSSGRSSACWVV